jgi:acetyltransferase-like isoleucine patch superfamily enzyme
VTMFGSGRKQVFKGVTIKEGSIIDAHSIVTTDVQQNNLVVGVPTKSIAGNVRWERENT